MRSIKKFMMHEENLAEEKQKFKEDLVNDITEYLNGTVAQIGFDDEFMQIISDPSYFDTLVYYDYEEIIEFKKNGMDNRDIKALMECARDVYGDELTEVGNIIMISPQELKDKYLLPLVQNGFTNKMNLSLILFSGVVPEENIKVLAENQFDKEFATSLALAAAQIKNPEYLQYLTEFKDIDALYSARQILSYYEAGLLVDNVKVRDYEPIILRGAEPELIYTFTRNPMMNILNIEYPEEILFERLNVLKEIPKNRFSCGQILQIRSSITSFERTEDFRRMIEDLYSGKEIKNRTREPHNTALKNPLDEIKKAQDKARENKNNEEYRPAKADFHL